jgi:arsenate reductase
LSVDHGRSKGLELYVGTQMAGGLVGVVLASVMFDLAPVTISTDDRATVATTLSEAVATSGMLVDRLTCRATASTFASPARRGLSR